MSVHPSVCLSVCLSVCQSLKISVTTGPIIFYYSGNIPTGPVVVLGYFLGGWDTPNPPKNKKIPPHFFFLLKIFLVLLRISPKKNFITSWGKAPEARGESASIEYSKRA